ncbi:HNH endonuclease [Sinomonas sp. P47F7]|uniref:HNH endonuclease n=1 Tax=Sinomonas sp. P47F7 TaxID=3410987 RepID=UPI003BF4B767
MNELFGFVARCATQSAAHELDYVVTVGTARALAGSIGRYQVLAAAAKRCGYWTETTIRNEDGDERQAWKLTEDEDLFHMILKAERAWTNQRKKDARDPALVVPVRLRDGDSCRYCGKTVSWKDRRSGRSGTYDHADPGKAATFETYVVACRECNGRRGDDPESAWKTIPAPSEPLYGPETTDFLAKHGVDVEPTYTRPAPASADGAGADAIEATEAAPGPTAPAPPAPGPAVEQPEATEAAPAPGDEATEARPASQAATVAAPGRTDLAGSGRSEVSRTKPRRDGTGRDRSGLDGKGRIPAPSRGAAGRRSRPRSRRNK